MLARKGPAIAAKDLACTSPSLVDALHQSMSHDRRSSRITSDEFDAKYRLFRELTPLRRRAVGLVAATVAGFGVGGAVQLRAVWALHGAHVAGARARAGTDTC